jgi:hypothetical protein
MNGQVNLTELLSLFLSDLESSMNFEGAAKEIKRQQAEANHTPTDGEELRVMFGVIKAEITANLNGWLTQHLKTKH